MSFTEFARRISSFAWNVGEDEPLIFEDVEHGKYVAAFRDGTRCTGNPITQSLTFMDVAGRMFILK